MKTVLYRLKGVWPGIRPDKEPSKQGQSTKVMPKNSITPGTTGLEAWIVSGLVSSLAVQIVAASLQQRLGAQQDINPNKEQND